MCSQWSEACVAFAAGRVALGPGAAQHSRLREPHRDFPVVACMVRSTRRPSHKLHSNLNRGLLQKPYTSHPPHVRIPLRTRITKAIHTLGIDLPRFSLHKITITRASIEHLSCSGEQQGCACALIVAMFKACLNLPLSLKPYEPRYP